MSVEAALAAGKLASSQRVGGQLHALPMATGEGPATARLSLSQYLPPTSPTRRLMAREHMCSRDSDKELSCPLATWGLRRALGGLTSWRHMLRTGGSLLSRRPLQGHSGCRRGCLCILGLKCSCLRLKSNKRFAGWEETRNEGFVMEILTDRGGQSGLNSMSPRRVSVFPFTASFFPPLT